MMRPTSVGPDQRTGLNHVGDCPADVQRSLRSCVGFEPTKESMRNFLIRWDSREKEGVGYNELSFANAMSCRKTAGRTWCERGEVIFSTANTIHNPIEFTRFSAAHHPAGNKVRYHRLLEAVYLEHLGRHIAL